MPIPLLRKVIRERRRAAVVAALAFVAFRLAGPEAVDTPRAAMAALALGVGAGLGSALAPRLRGFSEATALAVVGFAGLVRALPGSALDPVDADGRPLVALAFFCALVAVARGLRRGLRALPWPLLRNRRYKARASSPVDIHRLWYGLVPGSAHPVGGTGPDQAAIEDLSLRLGRVRLLPQTARSEQAETRLQILEAEPPFHIRMRTTGWTGDGLLGETGVSELFLVELGPRRLVLFAHEFSDLPLGRALLAWLDDAPGRLLDRRLAAIERGARNDDARHAVLGPAPGTASTGPDTPRGSKDALPGAGDAIAEWDDDAARDGAGAARHSDETRRAS